MKRTHHILSGYGVTKVYGSDEYAAMRQATANSIDNLVNGLLTISDALAALQARLGSEDGDDHTKE